MLFSRISFLPLKHIHISFIVTQESKLEAMTTTSSFQEPLPQHLSPNPAPLLLPSFPFLFHPHLFIASRCSTSQVPVSFHHLHSQSNLNPLTASSSETLSRSSSLFSRFFIFIPSTDLVFLIFHFLPFDSLYLRYLLSLPFFSNSIFHSSIPNSSFVWLWFGLLSLTNPRNSDSSFFR